MKNLSIAFLLASSVVCLSANADLMDRPTGIQIGERLTLRPYVSMSLTYDSNMDPNSTSRDRKKDDFMWSISPGIGISYDADNWSLLLNGFYNFQYYFDNKHKDYNHHTYGESLRWNWSNAEQGEKGWSIVLTESFQQLVGASDSLVFDDGENYSSDSQEFKISGAVQRQFNQYWHGNVNADYYWLDYNNDERNRYTYYGWDRVTIGAEVGYAPTKWTDLILSGGWMYYTQDNMAGSPYPDDSNAFSLQAGIGSFMTERISYRLLAGWSQMEYAGTSPENGFVYTATANWQIGKTWNTMFLASSYYQPSERQYATRTRVDALSWGLTKVLVSGKLRATLDVRYRHENHDYIMDDQDWDYNLNIWTGRIGLDYTVCRMLSVFAYGEYQNSDNDEAKSRNGMYDYDRWRVTVGFRLQY